MSIIDFGNHASKCAKYYCICGVLGRIWKLIFQLSTMTFTAVDETRCDKCLAGLHLLQKYFYGIKRSLETRTLFDGFVFILSPYKMDNLV